MAQVISPLVWSGLLSRFLPFRHDKLAIGTAILDSPGPETDILAGIVYQPSDLLLSEVLLVSIGMCSSSIDIVRISEIHPLRLPGEGM